MEKRAAFRPGTIWHDEQGARIEAHGGGVLYDRGVYYWFGEHKGGKTKDGPLLRRMDVIGISCYSSRDLTHWRNEGLALPAIGDDRQSDLHPSRVVERPKVVFNALTGKYVMWMHVDTADYKYARAGVAVGDSPAGPYRYLGSVRPGDGESRDLTVFKDDDGSAYLIHASEANATLHVVRLSDDYLRPEGEAVRIFAGRYREAPAVFKHGGNYCLITSGCTGWEPNAAINATAPSMAGPWREGGDPCLGTAEEAATTFQSQGTFVLPVDGCPGAFIFMADRWNTSDLGDSRYVWLPLAIEDGEPRIRWRESWDLTAFSGPGDGAQPPDSQDRG